MENLGTRLTVIRLRHKRFIYRECNEINRATSECIPPLSVKREFLGGIGYVRRFFHDIPDTRRFAHLATKITVSVTPESCFFPELIVFLSVLRGAKLGEGRMK